MAFYKGIEVLSPVADATTHPDKRQMRTASGTPGGKGGRLDMEKRGGFVFGEKWLLYNR